MNIHPRKHTHTLNYSQQEPSDRFTLQPGGMNIHTLKLPSAVSSGIKADHLAHTHPLRLIHPELLTPARSRPVGILQLGRVTEEVAHPVVKARDRLLSAALLFSTPLRIFSLAQNENQTPGPARAQTAKKDRNVSDMCEKDGRPDMFNTQK